MNTTTITPSLISDALAYIPATLPRDDWARVAMSIKSEFPDVAGFDLFDAWSQTGEGYSAKATRGTWQSVKAGGGVGIGTLLHLAKEHGFTLPKDSQASAPPSPELLAQRDSDRKAAQAAEQARTAAAQALAAHEAAVLWEQASETGTSAYLKRKGVQPYGLRFTLDGWVLVPMRDAAGTLQNVQRIAPEKPNTGSDKFYGPPGIKGGTKAHLFHLLGIATSPGTLPASGGDTPAPGAVLICEGYATGATLHEATARPVAIAFDAGNLVHVAKTMQALYPAALVVLCGDDDLQTFAEKGLNPGRDKATAAARAVHGLAVFPEGLPDGGTDFNDLHQHHGGAAGLEAVCSIVETAIQAHQVRQTSIQAAQTAKAGKGRTKPPSDASGAASNTARAFAVFDVSGDGVWHNAIDQDGKRKSPEWVCSRLQVEALTRDQDGGGWGYLLTFDDPLQHPKQWAMPSRMLAGDGGEYRATLLNMGLRIASTTRARNLLTQYIQTRQPAEFASCTDRVGWHGRAFVLPRETIGDSGERIVFQSESPIENTFRTKGNTEQWRERVGALCVGNSRLAFAVACAFAGPLMRPAGMESGGFHYRGDSSSGKTTALKLAASVWGGANYLQRWRSTDNALEATAAQHSDGLLILDELAQVDPKTAGECAYMLANEQGKARATRGGTPRARQAWRLLFLSAGELGLADHMAEGQKRTRTGQEVRMVDIPADAGVGLGAFENLHGHDGGSNFSRYITGHAASVYGAPGRAWLDYLTSHADTLKASIRGAAAALAAQMVPHAASGQVERVGARFALVGAAGEMATTAGLTSWPVGESNRAAVACFNAWLACRGGSGNAEVLKILRQVRHFLETHGDGRFTMWHRAADDHAPKTLQRAGVRRMLGGDGQPIKTNSQHGHEFGDRMPADLGEGVSFEYFVLAETFRSEICQGLDYQAVSRVLLEHGCLAPDKSRPFDCKARLPGIGSAYCYRITPAIFELDL